MYDAACQRLMEIPGVGPLIATALVAAIGNGTAFARARVHHNVAIIALANKLARIAWAVLVRQEHYRGAAIVAA